MSSSGGLRTTLPALTLTGAWSMPSRAVAVNTAMNATDFEVLVTTGAGAIAIALPVAPSTGRMAAVKKVDAGAGTVTVTPAAGTLDGAVSQPLAGQNTGILVQFDGANWWTVAEIAPSIL